MTVTGTGTAVFPVAGERRIQAAAGGGEDDWSGGVRGAPATILVPLASVKVTSVATRQTPPSSPSREGAGLHWGRCRRPPPSPLQKGGDRAAAVAGGRLAAVTGGPNKDGTPSPPPTPPSAHDGAPPIATVRPPTTRTISSDVEAQSTTKKTTSAVANAHLVLSRAAFSAHCLASRECVLPSGWDLLLVILDASLKTTEEKEEEKMSAAVVADLATMKHEAVPLARQKRSLCKEKGRKGKGKGTCQRGAVK